ncbi:hypothetical protein TNCV_4934151 [Trichonephila clavipes]|nr:hypothetical protein TNCV_4934151 [Trichonephila clavipes]
MLDGRRRAQLSILPRMEGVACFGVITGYDYLQAFVLKMGLADPPLCPLCKFMTMTGEHLFDCPNLLYVLSQGKCGLIPPACATSAFNWTARRLMSERIYWDILFLPPLLILFDAFQNNNSIPGQLSGDSDPEARGHRKQEDIKFKKQGKHTASLDILIQIMIQEELLRIGNKSAEC